VFVALSIQHAMRMRRIVICGLSACAIFSILPHKWHYFRKNGYWKKPCFNFLYNFASNVFHSSKIWV